MNFARNATSKRYDKLAPFFDMIEAPMEGLFFRHWRAKLWKMVEGYHILEIGIGTGKNFEFYPEDARITGVDFSQGMLAQAAHNAERKKAQIDLSFMDLQALDYADNSFDTVIGSFVFSSVPQPSKGLKELYRVCRPGGQLLLLEYVVSSNPFLARMMNFFNPLLVRLTGTHINRDTIKKVKASGFSRVNVDDSCRGLIKVIEARK